MFHRLFANLYNANDLNQLGITIIVQFWSNQLLLYHIFNSDATLSVLFFPIFVHGARCRFSFPTVYSGRHLQKHAFLSNPLLFPLFVMLLVILLSISVHYLIFHILNLSNIALSMIRVPPSHSARQHTAKFAIFLMDFLCFAFISDKKKL